MSFAKILNDYEEGHITKEEIDLTATRLFEEAVYSAWHGDKEGQARLLNKAQAYVRALAEICD